MSRRFIRVPRWMTLIASLLAILVAASAFTFWNRMWREHPQEKWITEGTPEIRFMYGSIRAERDIGIPYWIFYVMPSMFSEKLPGRAGYTSLGLPWQQGKELPIGLTKVVIGYPRVGTNCAFCHTVQHPRSANADPVFVPTPRGHANNAEALLEFLVECAKDPRFNSDNILTEIGNWTKLDWMDGLLYRFFIIPDTKKRLLERERHFTGTGHAGVEFGAKLRDNDKRALVEYLKAF